MSIVTILRADANSMIGTGHVMRSLSLASELVRRGETAIMTGTIPASLRERVGASGVQLVTPPPHESLDDDAAETVQMAHAHGAVWVIVDGYKFHIEYVTRLKSAGLNVIQFADGATDQQYAADILVDQNLGAEARKYRLVSPDAKALQGISFACIDSRFRQRVRKKEIPAIASKALITFGGSDPQGLTAVAVDGLANIEEIESVQVVVGAANEKGDEIERRCRTLAGFNVKRNVPDMASVMAEADIAVAAAGSTSWELAVMGVPSVLVAVADNQQQIAKSMVLEGVAESVTMNKIETLAPVVRSVVRDQQRRASMSQAGQSLIDGMGASRVIDAMLDQGSISSGAEVGA